MRNKYFQLQKYYNNLFDNYVVIFMMVGDFYELYTKFTDNNIFDGAEINGNSSNPQKLEIPGNSFDGADPQLSELLQLRMSKKADGSTMMGFPKSSLDKFIELTLNAGLTIIQIDQTESIPEGQDQTVLNILNHKEKSNKDQKDRFVKAIHSAGTSIVPLRDGYHNYLTCLLVTKVNHFSISICTCDLGTGKCIVYEAYGTTDDPDFALDEAYRFLSTYPSSEILIASKDISNMDHIISYLDINENVTSIDLKYLNAIPNDFFKIKYQNALLEKVIHTSDLDHSLSIRPNTVVSYCLLLQFVYDHNNTLVAKINSPELWESENYLTLASNCIYQLELVNPPEAPSGRFKSTKKRHTSVFDLINWTVTPMGRRLLKERLLNPIQDSSIIQQRYNNVQGFFPIWEEVYYTLQRIPDIERLHRRISLGILDPMDINQLDTAYEEILLLIKNNDDTDNIGVESSFNMLYPNQTFVQDFHEFQIYYKSIIDLDRSVRYSLTSIEDSIFHPGKYPKLDNLSKTIRISEQKVQNIANELSKLVDPKKTNQVKTKILDGDYYLTITQLRYKTLQKNFTSPTVNGTISPEDLTIHKTSRGKSTKTVDLICPQLQKLSEIIYNTREELMTQIPTIYCDFLESLDDKYHQFLQNLSYFVAQLDVYQSSAQSAMKYKYTRPELTDSGSLVVTGLRHPLTEQISQKQAYVPHNLDFNKDPGVLIFGLNGSGKSVLMKSVGIAVIMAQAGLFVPASNFKFKPYQYILTRILGNDNIQKEQSSYEVEMTELRAILSRANDRTLVLGDEVCRGTEHISGTALVASSLIHLSSKRSNFIFATHLHELSTLEEIPNCIGVYHIHIEKDQKTNKLLYHRTLTPGSGSSNYGIEVARIMGIHSTVIKQAEQIRKKLVDLPELLQSTDTSRYHTDLYKPDLCPVCKTNVPTEVHHIKPQRLADENGYIDHIHKNHYDNLLWLCNNCHQQTEHPKAGKLLITNSKTDFEYVTSE